MLDGDTRQLLRSGGVVPLGPKAFDLLELLLRERPRAVSLTRLRAALWPRTYVGATSIHNLVSQLRSALADTPAEARWIRTVARFGYAFCGAASVADAPVTADAAAASGWRHWLSTAAAAIQLFEGDNVLGREAGLTARFNRPGVSRRHACIRIEGGRATLSDLGSKNGTFVAGRVVSQPTTLEDGDELRLGRGASAVFRQTPGEDTETEG